MSTGGVKTKEEIKNRSLTNFIIIINNHVVQILVWARVISSVLIIACY